jgi:hypothetical protein
MPDPMYRQPEIRRTQPDIFFISFYFSASTRQEVTPPQARRSRMGNSAR